MPQPCLNHRYRDGSEKNSLNAGIFVYKGPGKGAETQSAAAENLEIEESNHELKRLKAVIFKEKSRYDGMIAGDNDKMFVLETIKVQSGGKVIEKINVKKTTQNINAVRQKAGSRLSEEEKNLLDEMILSLVDLQAEALNNRQLKAALATEKRDVEMQAKLPTEKRSQSKIELDKQIQKNKEILERTERLKLQYDASVSREVRKKRAEKKRFFFKKNEDGSINIPATIAIINYVRKENTKTLSNDQKLLLAQIEEALDTLVMVVEEKEQARSEYNISEMMRSTNDSLERKEAAVNKLGYKLIEKAFDDATSTPLLSAGADRFKTFWSNDRGITSRKARESKQLYFAIVGYETDFFNNDVPLPKEFGPNPEENRRRFPFIYHEWMKAHGVDMDTMVDQERIVAAKEKSLASITILEELTKTHSMTKRQEKLTELNSQNETRKSWREREAMAIALATELSGIVDNETIAELGKYQQYAHAQAEKFKASEYSYKVRQSFTRGELEKAENRQLVVEITMRKFQKAMDLVDNPLGEGKGGFHEYLHPTVRHLVIASIYEHGVAKYKTNEYGLVEYDDNMIEDYEWMMTQLTRSPHFKKLDNNLPLDEPSRQALKIAKVGNEVFNTLNIAEEKLKFLNALQTGREALDKYPVEMKEFYKKFTPDQINDERIQVEKQINIFSQFLKDAEIAIKNPKAPIAGNLILKIKMGGYKAGSKLKLDWQPFFDNAPKLKLSQDYDSVTLEQDVLSPEALKEFDDEIRNVEINYKMFDLNEHSRVDPLKIIGLNAMASYNAYLEKIKEDPKFDVNNWSELYENDFDSLVALLDDLIVGDAMKPDAKKSFLDSFRKLNGVNPVKGELGEGPAGAFFIYQLIQNEIRVRQEIDAHSDLMAPEIHAKLNGRTIGDKIEEITGKAWNDLVGPGRTFTERAAAGLLFYIAIKGALYAKNKSGGWGTALKVAIGLGAVEIFTDGGLSDMAKVGLVAQDMEGTYEGLLLQKGEKGMEARGITSNEHAAALYQLNKVPFHDLLAWYETSDLNGMPLEGQTDLFPRQIDLSAIYQGEEIEGRRRVYAAMEEHFADVGADGYRTGADAAHHGKEILKDHFVTYYAYPNEVKDKTHARDMALVLDTYKGRRHALTWKEVVRMSVDSADVEATKGQTGYQPQWDYLRKSGEGFLEWGRGEIASASGKSEEFFEDLGQTGEEVKEFLIEVGKEGGKSLHFAKEEIAFWFEGKEYKIRRWLGNKVEIVVQAAKLPLNAVIWADDYATDLTLKTLRQANEWVDPERIILTQAGGLTALDIVKDGDEKYLNILNENINPQTEDFGIYQRSCYEAFQDFENKKTGEGFFVNRSKERSIEYPDKDVGYYLAETKLSDIQINDPTDKNKTLDLLQRESWEKAKRFYMKQGLSEAQIEEYMFPITNRVTSGEKTAMYVFWRMPLKDSEELFLKETGKWMGYIDPRRDMDHLPFKIDPNKSFIENVISAYSLTSDFTRTASGEIGAWAFQTLNISFHTTEFIGNAVIAGAKLADYSNEQLDWIRDITHRSEEIKQSIDEFCTTASKGDVRTMSEFYQNDDNAEIYKICLEYAREQGKGPLYLGIFEGVPGYKTENKLYNDSISNPSKYYEGLYEYYQMVWIEEYNNPKSIKFENLIKEKMTLTNPTKPQE